MKSTPIRNNFNAGELSPKIDFRGDVDKYHSGCITMENVVPLVEGGAFRMPGTKYVNGVKDSSKATRVISFQANADTSYQLEFGENYIRVYKDKARVEVTGTPVEITTTYSADDLFQLNFRARSADILYIFHNDYEPSALARLSDTEWEFGSANLQSPTRALGHQPDATLTPAAVTGEGIAFTASAASFVSGDIGRIITYGLGRATITALDSTTEVTCDILDDFASTDPIASGSWSILGSPIGEVSSTKQYVGELTTLTSTGYGDVFTDLPHGAGNWTPSPAASSYEFYTTSVTEPDGVLVNGVELTRGVVGSLGIQQWDYGDNDALGFNTIYIRRTSSADPDGATSVQRRDGQLLTLFRAEDVGKYVYVNGGAVRLTTYTSGNSVKGEVMQELSALTSAAFTLEDVMWSATRGYPCAGVFFEQRLAVGGSTSFPQTINLSESDNYTNFTRDSTLTDDSPIEYTIVSEKLEKVNWLVASDFLMAGTIGGVWKVGASSPNDPITQTNITSKKQVGSGVSAVEPSATGDSFLWADSSGLKVHRLDYKYEVDKFISTNMARLASHITLGETRALSGVKEIAFQQSPIPIAWVLRKDGVLLGMTYETQEDVYAWFRVPTDGEFESVSVGAATGDEDQIWVIAKRTINGSDIRNVEYFSPMELFGQIKDSFFVHSGVTFDGGAAATITGITKANPAVVSCVNSFTNGQLVKIAAVEGMTEANTGVTTAYTVANRAAGSFELQGIDSTGWTTYTGGGTAQVVKKSFTTGLTHLEGEALDVVIDGAAHAQVTVTGGAFTLSYYGNLIHYGLPCPATLEPTKPYQNTQQGISRGKKQRISSATVSFYQTYGCKIGQTTSDLKSVPFPVTTTPTLFTGEILQPFHGDWSTGGTLVLRQDLPLPMTVRAIMYDFNYNED